jgi:hypothetical protein
MLQVHNALRLRAARESRHQSPEIFVAASRSPSTAVCSVQLTVATVPLQPARYRQSLYNQKPMELAGRDLGWAGTSHAYLPMRFAHPRIMVHLRTENAASWPLVKLSKIIKSGSAGGQRARKEGL